MPNEIPSVLSPTTPATWLCIIPLPEYSPENAIPLSLSLWEGNLCS